MQYILRAIVCLSFTSNVLFAQDLAQEFNRAMDVHLNKHLDLAIERLAPKLGITTQQLKDAVKIERRERQLAVAGYIRLPQSICELEGSFSPLEKSFRAMCLNDKNQLQIFY
jgi:hypothetical protein